MKIYFDAGVSYWCNGKASEKLEDWILNVSDNISHNGQGRTYIKMWQQVCLSLKMLLYYFVIYCLS